MGQGQGWDLAGRDFEGGGLDLVLGFAGGGGEEQEGEEGEEDGVVLLWKGVLRRDLVRVVVCVVVVWMVVVEGSLACPCPCSTPSPWYEEAMIRSILLTFFVLLRQVGCAWCVW